MTQTPYSPLTTHLLTTHLLLASVLLFGCGHPQPHPLNGKLTVLVRPPARPLEPVPVHHPGAAHAQTGGTLCHDTKLDELALIYLVCLDCQSHGLPLNP